MSSGSASTGSSATWTSRSSRTHQSASARTRPRFSRCARRRRATGSTSLSRRSEHVRTTPLPIPCFFDRVHRAARENGLSESWCPRRHRSRTPMWPPLCSVLHIVANVGTKCIVCQTCLVKCMASMLIGGLLLAARVDLTDVVMYVSSPHPLSVPRPRSLKLGTLSHCILQTPLLPLGFAPFLCSPLSHTHNSVRRLKPETHLA